MKKFIALLLAMLMLPILPVMAESAEMIVVYAQVPDTWAYPCAWSWNAAGENAFAAWPGDMMEPDATNPGWYYMVQAQSVKPSVLRYLA